MRYFIDTEFYEDGKTIDLISLAIVAEDGRELYLGNIDADFSRALSCPEGWVAANVLNPLFEAKGKPAPMRPDDFWKERSAIRDAVLAFCDPGEYGKPEFWAYYADYDWVVFCQLFGRMIDLPEGYPMFCLDLKQVMHFSFVKKDELPDQEDEHDALSDARWNKKLYEYLDSHETARLYTR